MTFFSNVSTLYLLPIPCRYLVTKLSSDLCQSNDRSIALQPTGIMTSIGAGTPVNNMPISLPTAATPMATATMVSIPTTATIPLSTTTAIPQPTASIIPQSTATFNTSNTSLI